MRGSITKKGNNYYVCMWIGGKKKWFSGAGKSKRKAERILAEKLAELSTGTYHEPKKIRFKEYAEQWLESYAKTKVKASTYRSYSDIINRLLIPEFGHFMLIDIKTLMLQNYVGKRLDKVSPKTVVNEIVPIKRMFKHAVIWNYLKISPAEHIEKPRVEREEMEILAPDEVNLFLDEVTPKYKPFFFTAVLTGMRRGELIGLQWGDIDWKNRQIHVRRAFCNTSKKFTTPKSRTSIRRIDMSATLVNVLKKHKLSCPVSEYDLVFCNSKGNPADPDSLIRRQFFPALRRANLRRVRFHDLRHTNVALRIEQDQNIKYIQRQMGHASIQTTMDRYGHVIKDVDFDQAEKLDAILGFAGNGASIEKG